MFKSINYTVHKCLLIYKNFYVDWLQFYEQPYILASLNQSMSKINPDIWYKSGNNTNIAEAAHSLVNKEGKQMNLLSAILRLVFISNFKYNALNLNPLKFNITFLKEEDNMMNVVLKP